MKIIIEKEKCIGCGSCAIVCPDYFELDAESKSHLKNSALDSLKNTEELVVSIEASCVKEATEVCPVQCIKIVNR